MKRVIELDVLRGVAILLVLVRHNFMPSDTAGFLQPVLSSLICFGWTGVDLFFVLSGFLIGGLLFAEVQASGRLRVRRFLIGRGMKIWPQYYTYLAAVVLIIWPLMGGRSMKELLHTVAPAVVHLQNYSHRWDSQLWSLGVEEHFYLLLPLIVTAAIWKWGGATVAKRAGWALIAVMVFTLALRCALWRPPFETFRHRLNTHIRLDSLAAGVLLSWTRIYQPALWRSLTRRRLPLLMTALVLLSPFFFAGAETRFVCTVGYTQIYTGYACLLLLAMSIAESSTFQSRRSPNNLIRAVAWVGGCSYGIYLWHMDAMNGFKSAIIPTGSGAIYYVVWTAALTLASITVGYLATILIERPILRLRDWIYPRTEMGAKKGYIPEPISTLNSSSMPVESGVLSLKVTT